MVARMKSVVRLPACQAAIPGPLFLHSGLENQDREFFKKKRQLVCQLATVEHLGSFSREGGLVCSRDLGEEENYESCMSVEVEL